MNDRWLLPEGVEGLLPQQAEYLEQLRRQLLDLFHTYGYELVMPPLIEYLESLQVGTGNDLDLQTFKLIDQMTGRLMGLRADMTPQVARIDAHQMKREMPTRLCYMGTVLHARPESQGASRTPLQVGAELYGHRGPESDVEVMALMLTTLEEVGVEDVFVDLGHVGIFRGLSRQAGLSQEQEGVLFDALQRKSKPEISEYLSANQIEGDAAEMLLSLVDLNGGIDTLDQAASKLAKADESVQLAIENLKTISQQLLVRQPEAVINYDLAELRGFHYHTGVVFAAYTPGSAQAIAQGGRYDDIGQAFGRARAATGFSADLKALVSLIGPQLHNISAVYAPLEADPALQQAIKELREEGERVIEALPGAQVTPADMGCDRVLVNQNGAWTVIEAENS